MTNLTQFFTAVFVSLAVENAVFSRVLGLNRTTLFLKSGKSGILYGGIFTAYSLISSLLISLVNYLIQGSPLIPYLRAIAYFVCVAALYFTAYLLLSKAFPKAPAFIGEMLPSIAFNTALFGAFYISAMDSYNVFQTIGYALGTGMGYTGALLVLYYARRRLSISPVPRAFRGLPVRLVYMGILSLAIYGLIGQGLPT